MPQEADKATERTFINPMTRKSEKLRAHVVRGLSGEVEIEIVSRLSGKIPVV